MAHVGLEDHARRIAPTSPAPATKREDDRRDPEPGGIVWIARARRDTLAEVALSALAFPSENAFPPLAWPDRACYKPRAQYECVPFDAEETRLSLKRAREDFIPRHIDAIRYPVPLNCVLARVSQHRVE
jgi:hypothetical protein